MDMNMMMKIATALKERQDKMTFVRAILSEAHGQPVTVGSHAPLMQAAALLNEFDLVIAHDEATGIMRGVITKSDIVRRLGRCPGSACTARVEDVMTKSVAYCHREDSLEDVLFLMKEKRLHDMPVVDDEMKPLGILNATDALQALLGNHEHEEMLLRDYIAGIGYR